MSESALWNASPLFIGRQKEIELLEERVIRPSRQRGSLALIGLHDIGKNKLIDKVFIAREEELQARRLLLIPMSIRVYKDAENFFYELVTFCRDKIEDLGWLTPEIASVTKKIPLIKPARKSPLPWGPQFAHIKRFFTKVQAAGIRPIVILDKFEYAGQYYLDDTIFLEGLRELAIHPDYQVAWVILSRVPLERIEFQCCGGSPLENAVEQRYLTPFQDEGDITLYLDHVAEAGLPMNQEQRDFFLAYCGGHPYLLHALSNHLKESWHSDSIETAFIQSNVTKILYEYYTKLLTFLKEQNLFYPLLQILFGPIYKLEQTDIDTLHSYGIIHAHIPASDEEKRGWYRTFSLHFHTYLKQEWLLSTEHCPEFTHLTALLQSLIVTNLLLQHKEIPQTLLEAEETVTLPQLFDLLLAQWEDFEPLFTEHKCGDREHWRRAAEMFTSLSQPLMQIGIDHTVKQSFLWVRTYSEELQQIVQVLKSAADMLHLFPQAHEIKTEGIREKVMSAITRLNVATVDDGLALLGRAFESALRRYLMEAYRKGVLLENPRGLPLVKMIECTEKYGLIRSKEALHYLRQTRNDRTHEGIISLDERQVLMNTIKLSAGMYIDYIKMFDDRYLEL
ncbi:hypothetical protein [Tengunoibacter tsumagoiensis]|uniref:Orc1-like AAA ATPase domain-containing protein n=1 Tax=Tengunoibacter tsumagoiensis TaxID=2014871 RepID=A0A401ZZC5_9CHLR|nr:hypothetical protein [Tengunoibacter tsumagoiensis]GCE12205.1 hypothetical protein KTT_20640 [Tengunoibacter tsumagoiensis]